MTSADIILSTTYTRSDFYRRLSALKEFLERRSFSERPGSGSVQNELRHFCEERELSEADTEALTSWGDEVYTELLSGDIYSTLSEVEEVFKGRPVLMVTVPVTLTEEQTRELGRWVRERLHFDAVIDVRVDRSMTAGCRVGWGSTHLDLGYAWWRKRSRREVVDMVRSL